MFLQKKNLLLKIIQTAFSLFLFSLTACTFSSSISRKLYTQGYFVFSSFTGYESVEAPSSGGLTIRSDDKTICYSVSDASLETVESDCGTYYILTNNDWQNGMMYFSFLDGERALTGEYANYYYITIKTERGSLTFNRHHKID